jgi:DUF4097 and DUF4098 domain-containing protein YvlB
MGPMSTDTRKDPVMPTFDTPRPIAATVDVYVGDVRITAGDRRDTTVEVRPTDPHRDADVRVAEQTRVEYADDRLLVKSPRPRALGMFNSRPGSIDVQIALPAGSHLRGDAGVGSFHCEGTLGEVKIKTATGDVRLDHAATLDLHTSSGAVVLGTVAGSARITTASGALRIGTVGADATVKNSNGETRIGTAGGDLKVSAANGDILVDQAHAGVTAATASGSVRIGAVSRGTVSLRTASGSLEVGVVRGTPAYLDLHTSFGRVRNDLTSTGAPGTGEQSVEVKARTSFGDIVVRHSEIGEAA